MQINDDLRLHTRQHNLSALRGLSALSWYAYKWLAIAVVSSFLVSISACTKPNINEAEQSAEHAAPTEAITRDTTVENAQKVEFYETVMNAAPFLPANKNSRALGCDMLVNAQESKHTYVSSEKADYANYGWEERIAHQGDYFHASKADGRILLIDFANANNNLAYRYLSNDNTHKQVYEPWSSSKIFAFTGAIAQLRKQGLGAQAKVGDTYVADMITGINSYDNFGTASGESNALATFFANIAGRKYLSGLFYDDWLKLSAENIYFKGAYGPDAFVPSTYTWQMLDGTNDSEQAPLQAVISPFLNAADDPAYLPYRCDACGLTGNKPMTTLAQAEWLKRLAAHTRDPATAHPNLRLEDIETLFYGSGNSLGNEQFAGMTLGISLMLQQAIVNAIAGKDVADPKAMLDELTKGEWRIFQKIGWGPSETRSTTENVVLAHVCLPHFQGGREFTVAAQVAVPEAKEEHLALAGMKMQTLLQKSLSQYFHD
ncbi:hypothetical protein ACFO4O_11360 [Glaciecola siphonariae]|uniref:Serine hydrolase n=1 Tax=Glaciecola siphonariae TaxID=521012 RepID=A0ABV9LX43_9ALTE